LTRFPPLLHHYLHVSRRLFSRNCPEKEKKKVNKNASTGYRKIREEIIFPAAREQRIRAATTSGAIFQVIRVVRSVMEERCLAAVGNFTVSNINLGKGGPA
jgi:hypothetical protein